MVLGELCKIRAGRWEEFLTLLLMTDDRRHRLDGIVDPLRTTLAALQRELEVLPTSWVRELGGAITDACNDLRAKPAAGRGKGQNA